MISAQMKLVSPHYNFKGEMFHAFGYVDVLLMQIFIGLLFCTFQDVLDVKQCESTEKEATTLINLESNLQDVRVVDTSEHTLKSLTQKRTG